MINFLHAFNPNPILIEIGPLKIHWYGLFIVSGILISVFLGLKLAEQYKIKKDDIIDLVFWTVLFGIIGARLYAVFLEYEYYFNHPADIIKIWQGGLAIHGGIIAGLIVAWIFSKKRKINYWLLLSIMAPGAALAQAIGRWGNYFNQELFGLPTDLPWGIPIEPLYRIPEYYYSTYYHPAFLYESIGNFIIFLILFFIHKKIRNANKEKNSDTVFQTITVLYLLLYSALRFGMEFIRIDSTIVFLGVRWPQIISLAIMILGGFWLFKKRREIKSLFRA